MCSTLFSVTKEIAPTEISSLLKEAGGSYVAALELLKRRRQDRVIKAEGSTVAQRKQRIATDIEQVNSERLMELHDKLSRAVAIIAVNSQIELAEDELLTEAEKLSLMQQYLDERDIMELLAVSKDRQRSLVFSHLTSEFQAQGIDDPENQNGEIPVPELGQRFCRERCGRTDATLNEDKLKGLLGDQQWASVCDVEDVPAQYIKAHQKYVLSEEKMLLLAQKDPEVLTKLLDCLEVGGWRTPVFTVKPLKER